MSGCATLPESSHHLPPPPDGYQWERNEAFSDEFNGAELDRKKWRDHFVGWKGRPPAKFMPSSVRVADGCLQIRVGVLDEPDGEFTLAGGAVQSMADSALYGYYECRMKASSTSMSSTFWLHSPAPSGEVGGMGLELDIVESIGNAQRWPNFGDHMMSNSHISKAPEKEGEERVSVNQSGTAQLSSRVNDDSRNTTYYDYVRSYRLVPVAR